MNRSQQFAAGITLFAAGVVVAIIGYLGVSKETDVAFQLPYFASAGVGSLLLFVGGATLIGRSQLSADAQRLDEIDEAVRLLAEEMKRMTDDRERGGAPMRGETTVPHKPRGRAHRAAR